MVNIWAVLVSGVLHWIVGALWYSPLLFAKPWTKLMKIDMTADEKGPSVLLYLGGLFVGIVMAAGLALLLSLTGTQTIPAAIGIALLAWLAFTAAPAFANAIFGGSVPLWAINNAYPLVTAILMSIVLTVWR